MRGWIRAAVASAVLLAGGAATTLRAAQSLPTVDVLQIRQDLYMLTFADGLNVAMETGPDGSVLVDSGPPSGTDALLMQIRHLSSQPIRFIIDTSGDPELIGGAPKLSAAGQSLMIGWNVLRLFNNQPNRVTDHLLDTRAPIIARQEVLERIATESGPRDADFDLSLPSETFTRPQYNFRINSQGVEVVHMPPAHSAGDSVAFFRGSDVVITGEIFDDTHFPVIDLGHGGSLQGEIDALNQIMNTLVIDTEPLVSNSGGTLVIPLRGPVCDQADLLTYRDMLFAVRNRIEAMIDEGKGLSQVEAADPTQGYDARYGSETGDWTTRNFVEAAYKSLMSARQHGGRRREP